MDPLVVLSVAALAALLTAFGLMLGFALNLAWDARPEAGRGLLRGAGGCLAVAVLLALLADFVS